MNRRVILSGGALESRNSDAVAFLTTRGAALEISAIKVQECELATDEDSGAKRQQDAYTEKNEVRIHRAPPTRVPQGL